MPVEKINAFHDSMPFLPVTRNFGSNWMLVITGRYQIFPVTVSEIMEEEQEE